MTCEAKPDLDFVSVCLFFIALLSNSGSLVSTGNDRHAPSPRLVKIRAIRVYLSETLATCRKFRSHRLLIWTSAARSVRSRLSGRAGHLSWSSLLFGHGAGGA